MAEEWETLESHPVLDRLPFLLVEEEQVKLPNGHIIDGWTRVYARDYVNVVVLNHAGDALVLEGYKHGIGKVSWQVVGGYIEDGEDPIHAAQRELLEEAGYASDDWTPMGSFVVDANRHVGVGHLFLARSACAVAPPTNPDNEEFAYLWVSLDELKSALLSGKFAGMAFAANVALALVYLSKK